MKPYVKFVTLALASFAFVRGSSATVIDALEMDETLLEVLSLRSPQDVLFDTLRSGEPDPFVDVVSALRVGDVAQARRALDRARAGRLDHPGGWELEGSLKLLEGDAAAAVQALERAKELAPEAGSVYAKLAAAKLATGDLSGAEADLEQATRLQSSNLLARILLARISLARGDTPTTIRHIRAGLEGATEFTLLHSELAELLLVQQRPAEVVALLAPLAETDEVALIRGRALLASGDLSGAEQAFARARTLGGDAQIIGVYLANIARLKGDLAESERALRRLNQELPNRPAVMEALATTLAAAGKLDESRQLVRQAASLLPPPHPGRLNLARLAVATGVPDLALEVTTPMFVTSVVDPQILIVHAQSALAANRFELAAEAAARLVRDYPNDVAGYVLGTAAAERRGRADEARAIAERGTVGLAENPEAWTNRINLLVRQQRLDEALQVTRTAIARNPNNLPLQFVEANVHELAGNTAEAEAIYRRLADEDATRVASLNNLANLLATRPERRQEALRFAREAISAAPGSPDIQDTLGWILHLNGESDDAIAYLRDAARQAPANPGIVCHYGIVKAEVESAASARGDLERCLELKPEPALARAATGLL